MYSITRFITVFVQTFTDIMSVLIIIRVLLSWLAVSGRSSSGNVTQIIYDITQPVINIARKIPHKIGMMDFSPIIALFMLDLLEYFILIVLKML